jgi:hypothetical protein
VEDWAEPIRMMALITSQNVFPNVKSRRDKMDIREWVKVKKIPGGTIKDCRYVDGLVFTKNIAHKKMKACIKEPHCLLFRCAIEFQKVENRFSSFDALLQQEQLYLKNLVSKISGMKPSLVVVEKTVSRIAQDFLLQEGLTLILNLKPKSIDLIHRFTAAEVLLSTGSISTSSSSSSSSSFSSSCIDQFFLSSFSTLYCCCCCCCRCCCCALFVCLLVFFVCVFGRCCGKESPVGYVWVFSNRDLQRRLGFENGFDL